MERERIDIAKRVSIYSVIGLKNTGRKQFISCPFHNERTASCVLYPDGHFHCFGCGVHGKNAIDFLMKLGTGFKEAVKVLTENENYSV